jgi:hypothetical protein
MQNKDVLIIEMDGLGHIVRVRNASCYPQEHKKSRGSNLLIHRERESSTARFVHSRFDGLGLESMNSYMGHL